MKVLASVVTVGFLVLGGFIPSMVKAESGVDVSAQTKPLTVIKDTSLNPQPKEDYTYVYPAPHNPDCLGWLEQAGIPITYGVIELINGESGCHPESRNASSGACGVAQELPCGKSGCTQQDPVCELKWMDSYTKRNYGSWEGAYNTWLSRSPHWY